MNLRYLLLAGLMGSSAAMADDAPTNPTTEHGIVKVQWQEPSKYRDIKSSGELQSRFENRLFETLTENLDKQAQKTLKAGETLQMVVTDVDLAGDMRPTFGATANDLRVVKEVYPPRITFSYQVLEGDKVIVSGDEKITDMNFLTSIDRMGRDRDPFFYETAMLNNWLTKMVSTMGQAN